MQDFQQWHGYARYVMRLSPGDTDILEGVETLCRALQESPQIITQAPRMELQSVLDIYNIMAVKNPKSANVPFLFDKDLAWLLYKYIDLRSDAYRLHWLRNMLVDRRRPFTARVKNSRGPSPFRSTSRHGLSPGRSIKRKRFRNAKPQCKFEETVYLCSLLGPLLGAADLARLSMCSRRVRGRLLPALGRARTWVFSSSITAELWPHIRSMHTDSRPPSLPLGLQELGLGEDFDSPLEPGFLPPGLGMLYLGGYNRDLAPGTLPSGLKDLRTGGFNRPFKAGDLPAGLLKLDLGGGFNKPLQLGVLPPGLLELSLGTCFAQPLLPGVLPASLLDLHLGMAFNQALQPGVLPSGLISLHTGYYFNKPLVPGILPAGLEKIKFGLSMELKPSALPRHLMRLVV